MKCAPHPVVRQTDGYRVGFPSPSITRRQTGRFRGSRLMDRTSPHFDGQRNRIRLKRPSLVLRMAAAPAAAETSASAFASDSTAGRIAAGLGGRRMGSEPRQDTIRQRPTIQRERIVFCDFEKMEGHRNIVVCAATRTRMQPDVFHCL